MGAGTPDEVVEGFSAALRAGDAGAATALFSRRGCVVTPDSTVITGRPQIRSLLQQLVDMPGELTIEQRTMVTAGDIAVGLGSWNMQFQGARGSVGRISRSMIVLGRIEDIWRIAVADPWRT